MNNVESKIPFKNIYILFSLHLVVIFLQSFICYSSSLPPPSSYPLYFFFLHMLLTFSFISSLPLPPPPYPLYHFLLLHILFTSSSSPSISSLPLLPPSYPLYLFFLSFLPLALLNYFLLYVRLSARKHNSHKCRSKKKTGRESQKRFYIQKRIIAGK